MMKQLLALAAIAAAGLCANAQDPYVLSLEDLNAGWDSSYDAATKTITYEGDWTGRGWGFFDENFDATNYTDVVIKMAECNVPGQMIIQYAQLVYDENGDVVQEWGSDKHESTTKPFSAGDTEITCALNDDFKDAIVQIYLQCGSIGGNDNPTIVLESAEIVDNSAVPYNPVVWQGEEALSWDSFVEFKPECFKAGDRIGFVLEKTGEDGGSFKAVCVDSSWKWCAMTSYGDNAGYSEEYESIWLSESGAVAAYINETDAANNVYGLQIGGEGLSLVKILYFPAGTNTSIYVTGDGEGLGGWDLASALAVEGEFGVHSFSSANLNSFKFSTVATTDWDEFNGRAFSAGSCEIGENAIDIYNQDWDNKTPWTGDYDVTIDLCAMTLTLATETPKPALELQEIYLRGGMNDWSADPAYLFSSEDGIVYTLSGVSIEAGVEFKFATSDWSTVDLGGVSDMVLDTVYTLSPGPNNCTVAESVSDVTITLNVEDNTVVLTTEGGIANIGVESAKAVYYNLQGVEVANPSNGIYLMRQGNKTSKVMVK